MKWVVLFSHIKILFFYLLKLTCKVCSDGVVVLIEAGRTNEFEAVVGVEIVVIVSLLVERF
jgi:hypothetical protein